jgi:prepilin-type N-terminal cleavage/methylation domain-containing protein/prepilin-type processing-associated H-X9-DG protein
MRSIVSSSRQRVGFTLIELLVVIAIIALLAAILFPVFARARENARKSSCLNNLKQLSVGFMQYTQDYDETLPNLGGYSAAADSGQWIVTPSPVGTACSPNNTSTTIAPCRPELGSIYSYVKNTQVYICPSDTYGVKKKLSYSMNSQCASSGSPIYAGRSIADAKKPSETIFLMDEGLTLNDGYFVYGSANDKASLIHLGGANNAYLDGHVKWKTDSQYQASDFVY